MKIQLKRSNVLSSGSAKEPTAAQMEYGELAVNYNENDPAIFLKDSNDKIIRIAGAGNLGNIEIPNFGGGSHQPGTLDDRYVEVAGDNMTGNLTLGTDKIRLDASDGSAEFAGDIHTGGFYRNILPTSTQNSITCVSTTANHNNIEVLSSINYVAGPPQNVHVSRLRTVGYQVNSDFGSDFTEGTREAFGFKSNMGDAANGRTYNFYAEGNAPNYFAGDVKVGLSDHYAEFTITAGSTVSRCLKLVRDGSATALKAIEVIADGATQWSVGYNGVASFTAFNGDTQIQMEADNPAAFTTSYALETDEEGNDVQVENTTYTGPTESLLDIIRDLRNRIAVLEGA